MKIRENVYQIRIDFSVTEQVRRFVNVYLITGRQCWLIDSGVSGSERVIFDFMEKLGRRPEELAGIFLTHSHPDHMGGAWAIKERTDCRIFASAAERPWIENIDLQYRCRPIPNFYRLAGNSVKVDVNLKNDDKLTIERDVFLEVMETKGHSMGDLSFVLHQKGEKLIFTGDAVPARDDQPIFISWQDSMEALDQIASQMPAVICPAWDRVCEGPEAACALQARKEELLRLRRIALDVDKAWPQLDEAARVSKIAELAGLKAWDGNPLFAKSLKALY